MRSPRRAVGLASLLVVAISVPALAQSSTPSVPPTNAYSTCTKTVTPAESEGAHTIYKAGKVLYDDGNYEAAITQFREAYVRDCTKHDLLIIISTSYEKKGDKAEAIRALELYLERVPTTPEATHYRTRIENMKKALAAQPPPPPPSSSSAAPPPTATTPPTAAPPRAEGQAHSIYPWIVVGVGGAALVTGLVIFATAPATPANCNTESETCAKRDIAQSDTDLQTDRETAGTAKSQPVLGLVIGGAGLAVALGGVAWHFLEPTDGTSRAPFGRGRILKESRRAGPKVRPALAPGYAGVSVGGQF